VLKKYQKNLNQKLGIFLKPRILKQNIPFSFLFFTFWQNFAPKRNAYDNTLVSEVHLL
jgi:hypothetical protein